MSLFSAHTSFELALKMIEHDGAAGTKFKIARAGGVSFLAGAKFNHLAQKRQRWWVSSFFFYSTIMRTFSLVSDPAY